MKKASLTRLISLGLITLLAHKMTLSFVPTPESLLRNPNNGLINSNIIDLAFQVEQKFLIDLASNDEVSKDKDKQKEESGEKKKFYLRYIFYLDNNDQIHISQILFNDIKMKAKSSKSIVYQKNFIKNFTNSKAYSPDQKLFISLLSHLALNNPSPMMTYLRAESDPALLFNEELINDEKWGLVKSYTQYLKEIEKDKSLKDTLESPLHPKSYSDKQKVRKIFHSSPFQRSPYVKLVREKNGEFFFKLSVGNIEALFSNEKRQLSQVNYQKDSEQFEVKLYNYLLFNGTHELPKDLIIQTLKGDVYTIKTLFLKHYERKYYQYEKMVKSFQDNQPKEKKLKPFSNFKFIL